MTRDDQGNWGQRTVDALEGSATTLAALRKLHGHPPEVLAKAAATTTEKIDRAERGFVSLAPAEAKAIAKLLQCDADVLDLPATRANLNKGLDRL